MLQTRACELRLLISFYLCSAAASAILKRKRLFLHVFHEITPNSSERIRGNEKKRFHSLSEISLFQLVSKVILNVFSLYFRPHNKEDIPDTGEYYQCALKASHNLYTALHLLQNQQRHSHLK